MAIIPSQQEYSHLYMTSYVIHLLILLNLLIGSPKSYQTSSFHESDVCTKGCNHKSSKFWIYWLCKILTDTFGTLLINKWDYIYKKNNWISIQSLLFHHSKSFFNSKVMIIVKVIFISSTIDVMTYILYKFYCFNCCNFLFRINYDMNTIA